MASACVNNVGVPPESFPPACHSAHGWLSPTISPRRGSSGGGQNNAVGADTVEPPRISADLVDFEFCLDGPVAMLPADELFSDGKLVPLQLAGLRKSQAETAVAEIRSIRPSAKPWIMEQRIGSDALVFSPKAPRCTTRWRELLGLKRQQIPKTEPSIETVVAGKSPSGKSFKQLLNRYSKASIDPSPLNLPLLHHVDSDAVTSTVTSRLSLSSSSSSGPEHDDLPRLSLDTDRPRNPLRIRISRPTPAVASEGGQNLAVRHPSEVASPAPSRGLSVDSPRMDPSGRIIFHGLERSSSSPGSFNGGPRLKHRGMERSYSSNIRAPSVLNVPVCNFRGSSKSVTVFGFGQLFSLPRKEKEGSSPSRSPSKAARPASSSSAAGRMKAERERERSRTRTVLAGI